MKTQLALEELIDGAFGDSELPIDLCGLEIKETPPPNALANLKTMHKLGILNIDAILSLIGQAPIDPINLVGSLMQMFPNGWVFSAVDFTMFHVLSRDAKKAVAAALRVDLIAGDTIMALARDKTGKLVEYKSLKIEGATNQAEAVHLLCSDTVAAAAREAKG